MSESRAANPSSAAYRASKPRRRKRRWPRILFFTAAWLVIILVVLAGFGILWLRSAAKAALPVLDGDIHLASQGAPALSAPVTVRRDAHGVPHIDAATQDDLLRRAGLRHRAGPPVADGCLSPQRQRRTGRSHGPLARATRQGAARVSVSQHRPRIYANLPADDRARLDDYARGVNLFIAQHQDSLPPEFRLLHYKPQPWTGADSVSIGMMMVEMLDTHWDAKLARERIAAKLHNPKLESDLYPVGSWRDHPPTGELLDLSQPHPEPPATSDDDDDDERTQPRSATDDAHQMCPAMRVSTWVEARLHSF